MLAPPHGKFKQVLRPESQLRQPYSGHRLRFRPLNFSTANPTLGQKPCTPLFLSIAIVASVRHLSILEKHDVSTKRMRAVPKTRR